MDLSLPHSSASSPLERQERHREGLFSGMTGWMRRAARELFSGTSVTPAHGKSPAALPAETLENGGFLRVTSLPPPVAIPMRQARANILKLAQTNVLEAQERAIRSSARGTTTSAAPAPQLPATAQDTAFSALRQPSAQAHISAFFADLAEQRAQAPEERLPADAVFMQVRRS